MKYLTPARLKILIVSVTLLNTLLAVWSYTDASSNLAVVITQWLLVELLLFLIYMIFISTVVWAEESRQVKKEELIRIQLENYNKLKATFENFQSALHEKIDGQTTQLQSDLSNRFEEQSRQMETLEESVKFELQRDFRDRFEEQSRLLGAIQERIETEINREKQNTNLFEHLNLMLQSISGINQHLSPVIPFPLMHLWTITPDYAYSLMETYYQGEQETIVDLGSGVSTLILGYLVKKNGKGRVISLEHDEVYYHQTRKLLEQHQLTSEVELYLAPLHTHLIDKEEWQWYDISHINFGTISMISVDGPPGNIQPLARYPVVPLLQRCFKLGTVLLLDDAHREEEVQIAKKFRDNFQGKLEFINNEKGLYIITF